MNLKAQLTCIAALALSLPWFAYSYLLHLDKQFRQIQESVISSEIRRLTSSSVLSDADYIALSHRSSIEFALGAPLLPVGAQIDGYLHEWPLIEDQQFVGLPRNLSLTFAGAESSQNELWLRFELRGVEFGWQTLQDAAFDELAIENGAISWRLRAAAEGNADLEKFDGRWQQAFDSAAVIRRGTESTIIEWQLPESALEAPLQLRYFNRLLGYSVFARVDNQPTSFLRLSRPANVTTYVPGLMNLAWFDSNGWLYASSSELSLTSELPDINDRDNWVRRLYLVWFEKNYPSLPPRQLHIDVNADCTKALWFHHQLTPVGQQCVRLNDGSSLFVEYSNSANFLSQARALEYFLWLCVFITLVLLAVFVGFGSLHSWRIRRLATLVAGLKFGDIDAKRLKSHSILRDEIDFLRLKLREFYSASEEKKAYLEALAPKLSHELKTPLAIISSSLDNLAVTDEGALYVSRARTGLERLSHILHAMTAAQSFEQILVHADCEVVPLQRFFNEIVESYQQIYAPRIIRFDGNLGDECWSFSPELVAQMLDKLVSNACDFCADGEQILVSASVDKFVAKQGIWPFVKQRRLKTLMISVVNVGSAIPKALETTLFDSLVSGRISKEAGSVHLGLGLYIARLICEWHGGTIAAASEPLPNGLAETHFTVTFSEFPKTDAR